MSGTETRSVERFAARLTAGAVLVLVTLAVFALVLGLVAAGWGPLHRLDLRIDDRLNRYFAPRSGATSFWRGVSAVGQPATFEAAAVIAALGLWLRRDRRLALFTVVTVIGASALNNVVKFLVDRARPTVPVVLTHPTGSSFPSGHAMASFVGLALLALLVRAPARRAVAITVTAGCVLGVVLVGFSRMALGAHYLSDVVGGWLLALAWLVALVEVFGVARRGEVGTEVSGPPRP